MPDALKYTPLERIDVARPVDRIAHIARVCTGKRVLDLGAMDETAYKLKRGHGLWLHEEIARKAARVLGVDASPAVPDEGLQTADNALLRRGDILDLDGLLRRTGFVPEVVVAGELIEHLENPLQFLRSLRQVPALGGSTLLVSTPNATALHNGLIAFGNRESSHADHLCILSFKTMSTLLSRAGYSDWQIIPYHSEFAEMKQRNSGMRRVAIIGGEALVRGAEWMFPLLSFGLIVQTSISA
jgi:2-polyprenyl-3-methyl-5-hydroxy-6-metoxy-1,4-benzoquinol methylase